MPTIVGLRRRGYTPEAIQLFCERIGVTKADGWIDYEHARRRAARRPRPEGAARAWRCSTRCKLVIDNWAELTAPSIVEPARAPVHPHHPELGTRDVPVRPRAVDRARRLHGSAAQGLLPPLPRQQGAAASTATSSNAPAATRTPTATSPRCTATTVPDTKSGTPGADSVQGQGHDHLGRRRRCAAQPKCACTTGCSPMPQPGRRRQGLHGGAEPERASEVVTAYLEPSLAQRRSRTTALPVRAPRLLRRRPRRFRSRASRCSTAIADAEGQLGQVILPAARTRPALHGPAFFSPDRTTCSWCSHRIFDLTTTLRTARSA